MRILYVEDDPLDADLTRRELAKSAPGFTLEIARTKKEAYDCLHGKVNYDLVLTDLRLPDGGGIDLLAHVRDLRLPLAVVVITGQGDEETAVAVLKAGADDYIVKKQGYLSSLAPILEGAYQRFQAEVARQDHPLRILYAEQDPLAVDLALEHFSHHAPHIHMEVIHSVPDIFKRLPKESGHTDYDVLMLNYHLYSLNALEVLKEIRQVRGLDIPIVLVTGHGDEEIAAQALRLGASDYVVKSPGYIFQLPGVVENAYHRVQLQREQAALKSSEKRFRALIENSAEGICVLDEKGGILYISPSVLSILGYTLENYIGENIFDLMHPGETERNASILQHLGRLPGGMISTQLRIRHKDGHWVWLEITAVNSLTEPTVQGIVVNFRDVTERKQSEESIRRQLERLDALRTVDMAITTSMDLKVTLAILLENVINQLEVHAADILLFDPNSQILTFGAGRGFKSRTIEHIRFQPGELYAGRAILDRTTISFPNLADIEHPPKFFSFIVEENFMAYYGAPLIAKGQVKGVLEIFHREPLEASPDWLDFFATLAGQAAIAIDSAELFEGLQRANMELTLAYDTTLEGWARALDLRDKETEDHTRRVVDLTIALARAIGIPERDLIHIRRGALLHDIGKIAISDSILLKAGPLTEEEWGLIRQHPTYAFQLLSPISFLRQALDIPFCHHERWDGTGYPRGLKDEQIPLAARIFAIVDVWDALSFDRPYRQKWERERVVEHIRLQAGSQLDPHIVEVFLGMIASQNI